ncbi:MAG: hypothetical protein ACM3UN_03390 [Bacillota bacterium]
MAQKEPEKAITPIPAELQAVDAIIKSSEYRGIFDSGFNIVTFAQQAEYRGMKGEKVWTQEMLQQAMTRYQQQVATHPIEPEKIDEALRMLSTKINVNIDRIRRCFYGIPEPTSKAVASESAPVDLFPEEEEQEDEQ